MLATRHTRTAADTYLDAARDCILAVGVKRTTITDIARRAGVARMTIYRSWPDMTALLGDLMVREWLSEAAPFAVTDTTPTPRDIAERVASIVRHLRENDLFRKIVDVDPEFLLPYVFERRGRTQDSLLAMIVRAIALGQSAGTLRGTDPELIARSILLTAHGFALSMQTVTDGAPPKALDAELTELVERYLQP